MKESDLIAPLGIMTLLSALKGRQNKMDAETAYANEVERLNALALQSQEETEDASAETDDSGIDMSANKKLTFSDNISELGGDLFSSILGAAFMPGGLIGKGLAFTMGMNAATAFGNETIQDMVEVIDPDGVAKTVPPKKEGEFSLFGLTDFYRDAAGDDGKLNFMPNVLAPGGQSPYLGFEDGGRVHLKGGGMDASKSDFGKSKKDTTKDTKSKEDTDNDNKGNKPSQSPNVGISTISAPFDAMSLPGLNTPTLGPMGTVATAMNPRGLYGDEEDSSPLGSLGKFNIGDVSINVDPFGATQLGVSAPIGSVYGLKNLFGYK